MKRHWIKWLIVIITFMLIVLTNSIFHDLQQPIDDGVQRQLARHAWQQPIKLVYFDDRAIRQLNGFPISRNIYSYLIHILDQLNTAVIGVDIFFPQYNLPLDENDRLLIVINGQFDNIINSYYFTSSASDSNPSPLPIQPLDCEAVDLPTTTQVVFQLPFPELLAVNPKAGFSNVIIDGKGLIRATSLAVKFADKIYPSFALSVALEYMKKRHPGVDPCHGLELLQRGLKESFQIHFTLKPEQLSLIPAIELMQAFQARDVCSASSIYLEELKNSIVLITILSENFGSYKAVPIDAAYPMAGVHAQIIENILANDFLVACPPWIEILILLSFFMVFLSLQKLRFQKSFLIFMLLGLLYLIGYIILFNNSIVLPLASVILFLGVNIVVTFITTLQTQRKILDREIKQRAALEKELDEKISHLTDLEKRIHHLQGSELTKLQGKISVYRNEIKGLKSRLNDLLIPTYKKPDDSELHRLFPGIIFASSSPMRSVLQIANKVAATNATVFLGGESGTGKELIAQAIHRLSQRRNASFIAVNCAAFPENLVESELFGYKRGAFTGATADRRGVFEAAIGGTVFLDEITETSLTFQAKLLRVIQEKEFFRLGAENLIRTDVRIITASNQNVTERVAQQQFREDLYYRLSVIHIEIPPLRERKADIPLLIHHFLSGQVKQISHAAMQLLLNYHFPGNVRELKNLIERAIILTDEPIIPANWLKKQLPEKPHDVNKVDELGELILEKLRQKEFQFSAISEIAAELGNVHRSTVTEHLKGIIFKAFYESNFSFEKTIRSLNPVQDVTADQLLKKRVAHYLRNLGNSISYDLDLEENFDRLKSRFKNLPQKYHFYFKEVIRKFLAGTLRIG